LAGDVCLSNFNFQVSVVFLVTLQEFQQNYLAFHDAIVQAVGAGNSIVIYSITLGSVNVNLAASSPGGAGSAAAQQAQNNLQNAVASGQTFGNMTVSSSSVSNSNNSSDDDSGLSTLAIILLAVLIPVAVISTYSFI
jgi:hypothetical protein